MSNALTKAIGDGRLKRINYCESGARLPLPTGESVPCMYPAQYVTNAGKRLCHMCAGLWAARTAPDG